MDRAELHRLVSLTFDERPSVRKEAAQMLANIDDPAAIFALIELSYDRDIEVKTRAQDLLQKKKSAEQDILSFAEIFSPKEKQQVAQERLLNIEQRRERVLSPITKLFEKRFGKGRADILKSRMMPTIEKIYLQNKEPPKDEESGKTAMQEILTSYLEAMEDVSGSEEVGQIEQIIKPHIEGQKIKETKHHHRAKEIEDELTEHQKQLILEDDEQIITVEDDGKDALNYGESPTAFRKAYDLMALSAGDERIMKKEMNRLFTEFKKDLKLAFTLARNKFKEVNVTSVGKIKDGMRNINTESLRIKSVENVEYGQKKKTHITKVIVYDEQGTSISLYLEPGRAALLRVGVIIKVVRGHAKRLPGLNEFGLVMGPKSNVYIVL